MAQSEVLRPPALPSTAHGSNGQQQPAAQAQGTIVSWLASPMAPSPAVAAAGSVMQVDAGGPTSRRRPEQPEAKRRKQAAVLLLSSAMAALEARAALHRPRPSPLALPATRASNNRQQAAPRHVPSQQLPAKPITIVTNSNSSGAAGVAGKPPMAAKPGQPAGRGKAAPGGGSSLRHAPGLRVCGLAKVYRRDISMQHLDEEYWEHFPAGSKARQVLMHKAAMQQQRQQQQQGPPGMVAGTDPMSVEQPGTGSLSAAEQQLQQMLMGLRPSQPPPAPAHGAAPDQHLLQQQMQQLMAASAGQVGLPSLMAAPAAAAPAAAGLPTASTLGNVHGPGGLSGTPGMIARPGSADELKHVLALGDEAGGVPEEEEDEVVITGSFEAPPPAAALAAMPAAGNSMQGGVGRMPPLQPGQVPGSIASLVPTTGLQGASGQLLPHQPQLQQAAANAVPLALSSVVPPSVSSGTTAGPVSGHSTQDQGVAEGEEEEEEEVPDLPPASPEAEPALPPPSPTDVEWETI